MTFVGEGARPGGSEQVRAPISFKRLPRSAAIGLPALRRDPLPLLVEVMQVFRQHLWGLGFLEYPTPAIRAHECCDVIPRLRLDDGRYLQDAPALALRRQMSRSPKVFALAQCFRRDQVDATHFQQFHMLDLYEKDGTLDDAVALLRGLVEIVYSGPIETVVLAEKIKADFDVDLYSDERGIDALCDCFRKLYDEPSGKLFPLLDRWICDEVEPLSVGKCLIVRDFPYAAEARAKPKNGTAAVSDRAEFQIGGVEIVHLYQDDPNPTAFVERAKRYGHHGPEDDIIRDLVEAGVVPRHSAGGAIGVERLCAVCLGLPDIYGFVLAPEFLSLRDLPFPPDEGG